MMITSFQEALLKKYLEYWHILFADFPSLTPASFHFRQELMESGYSPSSDQLILCLDGYDLEGILSGDGEVLEGPWRMAWKRELVHELCHEVQAKLPSELDLVEGQRIMDGVERTFSGPGHGRSFYAAISFVGNKFGVPGDVLVNFL